MKKQIVFPLFSFFMFILGMSCWIPNLFFYNPNSPPMFIFTTPFIGIAGIGLAIQSENTKIKYILIVLNLIVFFSIGLVFSLGTLIFGP